jgi:DNA-binding response OmpR family regulator
MRAALGERTPPAILVTAFNEEDLRPQARAAGFAQVLVKPITPSDLMDAMAQLLGKAPHRMVPRLHRTRAWAPRRRCGTMAASASCWPRTTPSTRRWPANCCRR